MARICEAFAPLVVFVRFALLAECYSEFMLAGNVLLTSQTWVLRTMLKPTTKQQKGRQKEMWRKRKRRAAYDWHAFGLSTGEAKAGGSL